MKKQFYLVLLFVLFSCSDSDSSKTDYKLTGEMVWNKS
jgi:hypothetical protein